MERPVNRIPNRMDPRFLQTFQVTSPISTHTRPASCEEVECDQYLRGWKMQIDLQTELGQRQAYYIKRQSGRAFKHEVLPSGLVELVFSPNQECFQEHRVRIDRPEIYRVKGGDYRGNPLRTPVRTHKKAEYWLEEFQENQDRIKTAKEKG